MMSHHCHEGEYNYLLTPFENKTKRNYVLTQHVMLFSSSYLQNPPYMCLGMADSEVDLGTSLWLPQKWKSVYTPHPDPGTLSPPLPLPDIKETGLYTMYCSLV